MAKEREEDSSKQKRSTATKKEQRSSKSAKGTVAIEMVKQVVEVLKPYELSRSERLRTFQLMLLDDAVSSAFQANSVFIEKAFANYTIEFDNNAETSKSV